MSVPLSLARIHRINKDERSFQGRESSGHSTPSNGHSELLHGRA